MRFCKRSAHRHSDSVHALAYAAVAVFLFLAIANAGYLQPPLQAIQTSPTVNRVVNMIPLALSGELGQDSEPFLTIDFTNPDTMAASAFTRNPFGSNTGLAPMYVSMDNGDTWALRMLLPSAAMTQDVTLAAGSPSGRLYGSLLRFPGSLVLSSLRTDNFLASAPMTEVARRHDVDQPFVQAVSRPTTSDIVYVGNNDLSAPDGKTATVDVSQDGGRTFRSVRIETRDTFDQDGPSIRVSAAPDGTVYAAFFGIRNFDGSTMTSDVVVVRDDNWGTGVPSFRDLTDPDDGLSGRIVERVTIPWSNRPTLGNERIGSTLSIAVDPTNSAVVYIAWADRVGNGDVYTVHVRRSLDRGVTWSADLRTISDATCIALAISDTGAVGFLYQQVANDRWVTHLEQSRDGFETAPIDTILADVPADFPPVEFLPYIGDYNYLLAVEDEFRGVFSANNMPLQEHFPSGVRFQRRVDMNAGELLDTNGNTVDVSIDPFYFSVDVVP